MPKPFTIIESPRDYAPRFVCNDNSKLYHSLAEEERIAAVYEDVQRDERVLWWQSFIRTACIIVAVVSASYFFFRLGAGSL